MNDIQIKDYGQQVDPDEAKARIELAAQGHTEILTTAEMQAAYTVIGFAAPFVVVERKADGQRGSLEFTHRPRLYFGFRED